MFKSDRGPNSGPCMAVLADWNQNPLLRVRSDDLAWNLAEQNQVDYHPVSLHGVDAIVATASVQGIEQGLSRDGLWLSLWKTIPSGQEVSFVQALLELARQWKKTTVTVGGDEFHFIPGVPYEKAAAKELISALESAGFKGSEVVDLIGDLGSDPVNAYVNEALALAKERRLELKPVEDLDALEQFLQKEFPGRWTREFLFWRSRPDTKRGEWLVLKEAGLATIGFARIAQLGSAPGGWIPGALRLPLAGEDAPSHSCLGPIGLAASEQGKGSGRVLLGLTLLQLQQRGGVKICIDWTNALRFYAPLGFNLRNRYWSGRRSGL